MKKIISATLALVFAVAAAQPVSAETTWLPLSSAGAGEGLVAIKELDHNGVSSRFSGEPGNGNSNDMRICATGPDSDVCDYSKGSKTFFANQVLPLCKTAEEENCVVGLRAAAPGQALEAAEFVREVNISTYDYEDIAKGLYRSGKPALFKAATTPAATGEIDYAVTVNVRMHYDAKRGKYITSELEAAISPFKEQSGGNAVGLYENKMEDKNDSDGIGIWGWGPNKTCAWEEQGKCGAIVAFTPESRFEIQVRVSKSIAGWFRGRIQRPDISVSSFSKTNNLITISAEPTTVGRLEAKINKDNTTAAQRALANKGGTTAGSPAADCKEERLLCGNIAKGQSAMSPTAIKWVEAFRNAAGDTAVANSTLWNMSTIDLGSANNRCLNDTSKVQGIVTTNATALEGTPPTFKGGYLTYTVAGLHYQPDGQTLALGSYDLIMRSETAQCLYGWGKAPLSATVSVVNEKGTKTLATTVVSEKNGWLKLAAYGFTFSKKTIKMKISKKKK